jgi:hypothetical protein
MLQSQALKDFPEEKESSKLYLWWIGTRFSRHYYHFTWKFFGNPYFQVKRLVEWYLNVFRYDFDFDGHSLFAIIEFKLKRVKKVLENGHAYQEPKDMKALSLAIKLAGRLKDEHYESVGHARIVKKWGESKIWFEPNEHGTSKMHSSRAGAPTPELEAQCWEETKEQYRLADIRMKREERWMYSILQNHLRSWWD